MLLRLVILLGFGLVVLALLAAVWPRLPDNDQRPSSRVVDDGGDTGIGRTLGRQMENHAGKSGIHLLGNGLDAFVARAVLASMAERSIDVQYYMFHQDTVGRLLTEKLLAAADRGVRVRMLIDDLNGEEFDDTWSALDSHRNIEVRMFNPFVRGRSRTLQFVTRLTAVNHRMHSKTYTVDNEATIVGGRNIGDEYFDANPELAFADLDVLAIGPVVQEVSHQFDEYWNNENSYPIATLRADPDSGALEKLRSSLANFRRERKTSVYVKALENSAFADALRRKDIRVRFTDAEAIYDSPEKRAREEGWKQDLLLSGLAPHVRQAREELILVSPYFIPGRRGTDALCELSGKGVRIRVLTNSLASNDVVSVHAGYARYRKDLLRCGVELFEMNEHIRKRQGKRFVWLPGLSKSSLHAKSLAIDENTMFVGSFNMDPRSTYINNEIGILFSEPELAGGVAEQFDEHVGEVAFRVELVRGEDGDESLRWVGVEDGREVVLDSEPYAGFWAKLSANVMRFLPIESML